MSCYVDRLFDILHMIIIYFCIIRGLHSIAQSSEVVRLTARVQTLTTENAQLKGSLASKHDELDMQDTLMQALKKEHEIKLKAHSKTVVADAVNTCVDAVKKEYDDKLQVMEGINQRLKEGFESKLKSLQDELIDCESKLRLEKQTYVDVIVVIYMYTLIDYVILCVTWGVIEKIHSLKLRSSWFV